ncbi:MAG: M48 family metallopeptidase [Thermoplasmatota archaeon]
MVSSIELRTGRELFDLTVAAVSAFLIITLLGIITFGAVYFWAVVGLVITIISIMVANSSVKRKAVRVTRGGVPEIEELVDEARSKLEMGRTEVYIDGSREVNAYTRGIFGPIIVLHKGLVDVMNRGELLYVIGHEMGHIKLKHSPLKTLFEAGMVNVPLILYLPLMAFRLLFFRARLSRSMEHSADRAGLHACGDIRSVVGCMLKLKSNGRPIDRGAISEAISMGLTGRTDDFRLSELLSSHPETTRRIREIVEYSKKTGVGWVEIAA